MGSWREAPPVGQARAKPSLAPQRVSLSPRAQFRLPVCASSFTSLRPSFLLPESKQVPNPDIPSRPLSPKVRGSPIPTSPQTRCGGEYLRGERAREQDPAQSLGSTSPRDWVPAPGAWGQTQGPDPSSPLYLARPATLRGRSVQSPPGRASSSHCCQPYRATGVLLGPFASRSRLCPCPPPLSPPSKVPQLFCLRIFCKVSAWSPGVGQQCQARLLRGCPAPAFPRPPALGPARKKTSYLWSPSPEHPLSVVRNPLPLPLAFTSRSGCRLPVPRVLISLLMNILTEANAGEN